MKKVFFIILLIIIISIGISFYIHKNNTSPGTPLPDGTALLKYGYPNDSKTTIVSMTKGDIQYSKEDGSGHNDEVSTYYVAKIQTDGEEYYIALDAGASADYQLQYYQKINNKLVYKGHSDIGAEFPGNGYIYTKSYVNSIYPGVHRTYTLDKTGNIIELPQDRGALMYRIDFETEVVNKIILKDEKGVVITELKPGDRVKVISLDKNKGFLLHEGNNLSGYADIDLPRCGVEGSPLKDMCLMGD